MKILKQGKGTLFTDPDPDNARKFFRLKNRKMVKKDMTLKQAVQRFVVNGEYLAIGGFGTNRTPIAACHEIVRQKKKNMGFAAHTSTHDFEILCAGKVFDRVDVAYILGLEARGMSMCARRYLEKGKVKVTEWTNNALSIRLKAAAMGIPYIPARNMMETDTFICSAAKITKCPYTGKKTVLLPALYPDVSFIHVHEADVYGNARFKGIAAADIELANASKKLIIITERFITNTEIRSNPSLTNIPFYLVDAVCEVPFGAYPGSMPYEYFSDEEHLKLWLETEKDPEKFKEFLDCNIFSCRDHEEYIMKNGGLKRMSELRNKELLNEVSFNS